VRPFRETGSKQSDEVALRCKGTTGLCFVCLEFEGWSQKMTQKYGKLNVRVE
jgi:hypothetical protein